MTELIYVGGPRPSLKLTRRAFQNRFPLMPDGASRKYDAMSMFLTNESYATSLVPDQSTRQGIQLLIQAGLNRMNVSPHVDLEVSDAAAFTGLLTLVMIPTAFKLTADERNAILSTDIQEAERFNETGSLYTEA